MNPALPGEKPSAHTPLWKALLALAIFGIIFVSVMAATGAYCYYLPRLYCSKAAVEIKQSQWDLSQFHPTSFQQIQSKETLYPVIDDLKLGEAWRNQTGGEILSKDEIYRNLVGMLELMPWRNTDFIQIGVYSKDRVEAAQIANQIAVVFQKQAREKQQQVLEEGLSTLKQQVDTQRQTVETARAEMEKIREQSGIADPNPESLDSPQPNTSLAYINAKLRYINSKHVFESAKSRFSTEGLQLRMQSNPVKIWEKAEPSINPSAPTSAKITTLMTSGVVAGLFLGSLAAGLSLLYLFRRV